MADKPQTSSVQFSASDADVIFLSSDGVRFNIHRRNLEVSAGAFPPTEFVTSTGVVPLTESSAILELLFQFAYPQTHPDVDTIEPFETFAGLAEAAEKYDLYAAINVCRMRMKYISTYMKSSVPSAHHAFVLAYASKHGYTDLADVAAPLTLGSPQVDVVALLGPAAVLPYLKYTAAWNAALREAYIFFNGKYTQHTCSYHQKTILLTLMNLGVGCPICNTLCQQCRVLVQTKISQIPKFSTLYSDFLGQST